MTKQDYIDITYSILKNDWDENPSIQFKEYSISQFQGTAFDSDYHCYKIHWSEWDSIGSVRLARKIPYSLVAKETTAEEEYILRLLSEKNFPVPKLHAAVRLKNGNVMIFEQFLFGDELYSLREHNAWLKAANSLSCIHYAFWNLENTSPEVAHKIQVNNKIVEKIHCAQNNTAQHPLWKKYMLQICKRLSNAPKTLIHGDTFPTNILINGESISFIDWANASNYAYIMDIGRLTAIIDKKTLLPMCPCPDEIINIYYEKMLEKLNISYNEYLNDVRMAQFLELAAIYTPTGRNRINSEYNQILEKKLDEIVIDMVK